MVIYGDILFLLNAVVDYLIISLTCVVTRLYVKLWRQIISSAIGGIAAFYIFVENDNILIDIGFRIAVTLLMMAILFGFRNARRILKTGGVYFVISLLLSGGANLFANTLKFNTITTNNTFFYIGISPIMLIAFSVGFYFLSVFIFRLTKNTPSGICRVEVSILEKTIMLNGLIDSGDSLTDIMSNSEVFITGYETMSKLTGLKDISLICQGEYKNRYRAIITETVSGQNVLYGIRCDRAKIFKEENEYVFNNPIIAFSKHLKSADYDIIIPQKALEGERYEAFR